MLRLFVIVVAVVVNKARVTFVRFGWAYRFFLGFFIKYLNLAPDSIGAGLSLAYSIYRRDFCDGSTRSVWHLFVFITTEKMGFCFFPISAPNEGTQSVCSLIKLYLQY